MDDGSTDFAAHILPGPSMVGISASYFAHSPQVGLTTKYYNSADRSEAACRTSTRKSKKGLSERPIGRTRGQTYLFKLAARALLLRSLTLPTPVSPYPTHKKYFERFPPWHFHSRLHHARAIFVCNIASKSVSLSPACHLADHLNQSSNLPAITCGLRSGRAHCDLVLAVQVARRSRNEEGGEEEL